MTRAPCKRRWEIEALEDGRLAQKDRASLARHAESCEECERALARLRELGRLLAELPTPEPTELERRRARAALLARANQGILGDAPSRRWMRFAFAPALVAVVLFVVVVLRGREHAPVASTTPSPPAIASAASAASASAAPLFEVRNVANAEVSSERAGSLSRVTLRAGTAAFHVEHVNDGARFLVALPDGEVEVRGTRFVVEVSGGHTRAVVVTEGVVAVRVEGFEGVLGAGERWPRLAAAEPAPLAVPSSQPSAAVAVATPDTATARPLALPGPRFAEAMRAFSAGDYGEADRLFVAFVRDFPGDTRAEDASFLIADARAHRGDTAGAREAAQVYLLRYPNGLRAPAAARLAAAPSVPPP